MRRLCAIADVSPKCFYAHRKGLSAKSIQDNEISECIRNEQEKTDYALGYRPMVRAVSEALGIRVSRNRIRRIMKENGLQSG